MKIANYLVDQKLDFVLVRPVFGLTKEAWYQHDYKLCEEHEGTDSLNFIPYVERLNSEKEKLKRVCEGKRLFILKRIEGYEVIFQLAILDADIEDFEFIQSEFVEVESEEYTFYLGTIDYRDDEVLAEFDSFEEMLEVFQIELDAWIFYSQHLDSTKEYDDFCSTIS